MKHKSLGTEIFSVSALVLVDFLFCSLYFLVESCLV